MAVAVLKSRALSGMEAPEVTVEVHLGRGLPSFSIVGLADTEVKEARERVRAAIQNARFDFPASRVTVNLAPADLPKVQDFSQNETVPRSLRPAHDNCDWGPRG